MKLISDSKFTKPKANLLWPDLPDFLDIPEEDAWLVSFTYLRAS